MNSIKTQSLLQQVCCQGTFFIALLVTLLLSTEAFASTKPNIILILADDLGWKDVGFMGNDFIETPHLDRLANEGLVFTHAYANSPNCAPSRAAIMSGQYAPRTGIYTMVKGDMGDHRLRRVLTPNNQVTLQPEVITVAERLKTAGYATAHIGKWNLGAGDARNPQAQGFDVNIAGDRSGTPTSGYFAPYGLPGLENAPTGEYLTDRLNDETVRFIDAHHQQPFFIYLSHFAPHFPFQAPDALVEKYMQKKRVHPAAPNDPVLAAMIEQMDSGLGKILDALHAHQLHHNTMIVFTADNGGYSRLSNMEPLRGEKSMLYEGGIRVPMMIWWPEKIQAGESREPVMGIDLYPTVLRAAGVAPDTRSAQVMDGADLSPLFERDIQTLGREALFWYFPGYVATWHRDSFDELFGQRPALAMRAKQWKLIAHLDSDALELFDLSSDPSEQHNLADTQPEQVKQLKIQLEQWQSDMGVNRTLTPNPEYDPAYEARYLNSWWRKMRYALLNTRLGPLLRDKDL